MNLLDSSETNKQYAREKEIDDKQRALGVIIGS